MENTGDDMGTSEDMTNEDIPQVPCISLEKSSFLDLGEEGYSNPGDVIEYMYVVTNCGNVTLTNLEVTESMAEFTGTGDLPIPGPVVSNQLNPGESGTASASYAITVDDIFTGIVTNSATVEGDTQSNGTIVDESDSGNLADEMGTDMDPTNELIPFPPCLALACNNLINLSLNGDCEALILPDMILEGMPEVLLYLYEVEVYDQFGNLIPNDTVTEDHLGQELTVKVTTIHPDCLDYTCWGNINIEDKLEPSIECDCPPGAWMVDANCQRNCLEVDRITSGQIGSPVISENCRETDAVFTGYVINEGNECGEYIISQNWTIYQADEYGNLTNTGIGCENEYYVFAADIGLVDLPSAEITIECDDAGADPFHPDDTGYPILGNDELGDGNAGNAFCNLIAFYSDIDLAACGNNPNSDLVCADFGKVVRTWTVLDWCNGESETFTQILKVLDNEAPEITVKDVYKSVDPWECAADVWIADDYVPIIHDNCSYGLDWYITGTNSGAILVDANGNANGSPKKHALNVPKGTWIFTIASVDCCGNIGTADMVVTVEDKTPPIPVAHQGLIVGLTSNGSSGSNDGLAKIFKEKHQQREF